MVHESSKYYFGGSLADYFRAGKSINLLDRQTPLTEWLDTRYKKHVDPFSKSTEGPILAECKAQDRLGRSYEGVNMASQDYLSLASHPAVKEAAKQAIEAYGVHSAGSPALMGNTTASVKLEKRIADFVQMDDCTVFATGWAAGYGIIKTLVSPKDHIVIDYLSHASLQEGARNATKNVHLFAHLSLSSLERKLKKVRTDNPDVGILIVTESLFSMDSDTPDIKAHQELANQYNATLVVDVAHDLGCMGPTGRGILEMQEMLGKVDVVMGSFSKTFASNGGFVASNHHALKLGLRYGCGPLCFSNAISPVQASVVLEALDIIESDEGKKLREKLMRNILHLRATLTKREYTLIGEPSAIVPVVLGDTRISRLITRRTLELGGLVNLVEYPAVAKNGSRHRLQVMANHTEEQIDRFVDILLQASEYADRTITEMDESDTQLKN